MIRVSDVTVNVASAGDQSLGLLAFISLVLNDEFVVDGITLRRTADGRTTLSFPERRDRRGGRHAIIRPRDPEARASFEQQVKDAIHEQGTFL